MSHSEEADNGNICEFKWGKRTGHGRSWKDIQYYESFTYDGVEYFLYDCAYLHVDDEPDHYIGKLVKIWEHPVYKKRVTIVWFFRPLEMYNWLGDIVPLENEIFLASGEGVGLVNINPVEALAGKCNVVCTSKDKRNPQPSEEELIMADHIFYRTFDVGKFTISDKFENIIAKNEVKYFFNRNKYSKLIRDPEPKGTELKKPKASGFEKDGVKALISQAEDKAKLKSVKDLYHSGSSENSTFEKIRLGDSAKHSRQQGLTLSPLSEVERVSSTATTVRKPIITCIKDVAKSCAPHVRTSEHEGKLGGSQVRTSEHEDKVGGSHVRTSEHEGKVEKSHVRTLEDEKKVGGPHVRISEREGKVGGSHVRTSEHEVKGGSAKDFVGQEKPLSKVSFYKKETMLYDKATPELAQEKGTKTDNQYLKMKEPVKDFVRHDGGISSTVDLSKKTTKLLDKDAHELAREKGTRTDMQCLKMKEADRIAKRMKEPVKDFVGRNREISSTVNLSKKAVKLSDKEAPEPPQDKGIKTDSHILVVNQRPAVDRSKWFKQLPWEERMDLAYQKGSLVRLQNLDPSYTSAEIEGIFLSIFKERCTAKVFQRSTFSSRHNGQAFVIFKSRENAETVITELCKKCLMLPNGRPLIALHGTPMVVSEKPTKFIGHLTIDKLNLQKQREQKKAVSTSHFAQPNTIEYEMALEWTVLQKQWELVWEGLFEVILKECSTSSRFFWNKVEVVELKNQLPFDMWHI